MLPADTMRRRASPNGQSDAAIKIIFILTLLPEPVATMLYSWAPFLSEKTRPWIDSNSEAEMFLLFYYTHYRYRTLRLKI